ncbi:MAG: hypothetical protein ACREDT_10535 [Methylocella sp.]
MRIARSLEWIAFTASSGLIVCVAAFFYTLGPGMDNCVDARELPVQRGVLAEAMARYCAALGLPNETRLGLHLSDESSDTVLVYFEPRNNRDPPVLRWIDAQNLSVDLGEVKWLTPQVGKLGRVKISYTYSGAEPSLE